MNHAIEKAVRSEPKIRVPSFFVHREKPAHKPAKPYSFGRSVKSAIAHIPKVQQTKYPSGTSAYSIAPK